jgi:hypothetical protein
MADAPEETPEPSESATTGGTEDDARGRDVPQGMVPARRRRRTALERGFMRIVATAGVVAVGVTLGAILVHQHVDGWIVGLVVSLASVVLAALLWSSREL